MSDELIVGVAQPLVVAGDLAANAARHAEDVVRAGARVLVFPELSLTGYDLAAPAVDPADTRLAPLEVACARTGTLALAGAPVLVDGDEYLAVLAIGPSGDDQRARPRIAYRKTHLGDAEAERFTPGSGPSILTVDGWRLALGICKDTGVAEHVGAVADLSPDLYAAGLVDHPHELEEQERRARRIAAATGAAVAFASFAGPTLGGYDRTAAGSAIWSDTGAQVASAGSEVGGIATTTLTRRRIG